MLERQKKVSPLVRQLQRAAAALGKLSAAMREMGQLVTALLIQIASQAMGLRLIAPMRVGL